MRRNVEKLQWQLYTIFGRLLIIAVIRSVSFNALAQDGEYNIPHNHRCDGEAGVQDIIGQFEDYAFPGARFKIAVNVWFYRWYYSIVRNAYVDSTPLHRLVEHRYSE